MKICPHCKKEKSETEFGSRNRKSASGEVRCQLRAWCRSCENEKTLSVPLEVRRKRSAEYRAENLELCRERSKRSAKAHPETNKRNCKRYYEKYRDKILEKNRTLYIENHEELRAKAKAYYEKNPEKFQVWRHTRRARLANTLRTLTTSQWEAVLTLFGKACAYCQRSDVPVTMDHVHPISKGGSHTEANVVPACRSCNASKNNKTLEEWAGPIKPLPVEN